MMRPALQLLILSLGVFIAAFALRWAFFWDVKPISAEEHTTATGALETAFLLLSIQNVAAVVSVIALAVVGALWLKERRSAH